MTRRATCSRIAGPPDRVEQRTAPGEDPAARRAQSAGISPPPLPPRPPGGVRPDEGLGRTPGPPGTSQRRRATSEGRAAPRPLDRAVRLPQIRGGRLALVITDPNDGIYMTYVTSNGARAPRSAVVAAPAVPGLARDRPHTQLVLTHAVLYGRNAAPVGSVRAPTRPSSALAAWPGSRHGVEPMIRGGAQARGEMHHTHGPRDR